MLADETRCITHGDYRIGNLIFAPDRPEVVSVLDWEISTLGHPLADLAHFCIGRHSRPDQYCGIPSLDHDALGLPGQAEFEDAYYAQVGHGLRLQPFHMAFALFRWAVVFEGIAARGKAGTASDPEAVRTGLLSREFARLAVVVLERDRPGQSSEVASP